MVTEEMIKQSWIWSDILSSSFLFELPAVDEEVEVVDLRETESQRLVDELDQLIQQFPITEPFSVYKFISIDDNIEQEEISIREIVDMVLGKGLENNDEEETISMGC
ncbi:6139_t:CDS:2 [Acaulospora morrowiae]|uniref:6139_t:CDS:1 n=1 Tax=Acaulospora morrowiae TaxID=94023 RepID=A0A9N9DHQ6_9GLOM|nr:6139_t:CDS:2 [Acaulospora morrowiae]